MRFIYIFTFFALLENLAFNPNSENSTKTMSEKGHAKNLENFKRLNSAAVSWGVKYAPTNPLAKLPNLDAVIVNAEDAMEAVRAAFLPRKQVISERADAFENVDKLIRRSMNMLASSGVEQSKVDDARTFARKFYGERQSAPAKDNPETVIDESAASHSASQQSYTQKVEHLENYLGVTALEPLYAPNEADLKQTAMQAVLSDLKAKNEAVIAAAPYDNALDNRDAVFYAAKTGLVDVAKAVKQYVKAAFGADSAEYNQIKDLEFKTVPN